MSNILHRADQIVNGRSEEKARKYGDFRSCMERVARLAREMGSDVDEVDCYRIMIALKLAREAHAHREDNLLDAVAYAGALNDLLENAHHEPRKTVMVDAARCVVVVGDRPKRGGNPDRIAFTGGRTGRFIDAHLGSLPNLVLTNRLNYDVDHVSKAWSHVGDLDLRQLIDEVKPVRVVTLGACAAETMTRIKRAGYDIVHLPHPSFILRFNVNVSSYVTQLIQACTP